MKSAQPTYNGNGYLTQFLDNPIVQYSVINPIANQDNATQHNKKA